MTVFFIFCRVRIGDAPPARITGPDHVCALEKSIRGFTDKPGGLVVIPEIGFDSIEEAYDFYNMYSWEVGFGICYGKRRLNIERQKCM